MKKSQSRPVTMKTIVGIGLSVGNMVFSILSSFIYLYLLGVNLILQLGNRRREFQLESVKKEKYNLILPADCPERITLPLKEQLATLNTPAGKISILKTETPAKVLAEWRDIFIKDTYLTTIRHYFDFKINMRSQFIAHKLEILRDKWDKINPEDILGGGLHTHLVARYQIGASDEKKEKVWDWRSAYRTENPDTEMPETEVMDQVERDYPNFRDKVQIKKEHWSRTVAESMIPERPNYTTEEEYNDPKFWEGVVVSVRNPGDSMIIVQMLRIFKPDANDDNEDPQHVTLEIPITFVEGVGTASQSEQWLLSPYFFSTPPYNLYGREPNDPVLLL